MTMMMTDKEIEALRDRLWERIRNLPGVQTIGVRFNEEATQGVEFVVYVEPSEADRRQLPSSYHHLRVRVEDDLRPFAH